MHGLADQISVSGNVSVSSTMRNIALREVVLLACVGTENRFRGSNLRQQKSISLQNELSEWSSDSLCFNHVINVCKVFD